MSIVDHLYREYSDIVGYFADNSQPSYASDIKKYFTKTIVLSSASFFEHEIRNILVEFVARSTDNNIKIVNLFKKKAIDQNYHTFFDWGEKNNPEKPGKNANVFFAMFGDDFKTKVQQEIKDDDSLNSSVKAFLEIGHLRNILVHSNFAAYELNTKTPDDVYKLHKESEDFIQYIKDKLK